MIRAAAIAFIALILAGCATTPEIVPVVVPCRAPPVLAAHFAFDSLEPGADIFTQVKTLLADRRQRIAYEAELRAAAEACSK